MQIQYNFFLLPEKVKMSKTRNIYAKRQIFYRMWAARRKSTSRWIFGGAMLRGSLSLSASAPEWASSETAPSPVLVGFARPFGLPPTAAAPLRSAAAKEKIRLAT